MSDLIHGGDLVSAQRKYGIAIEDWLDLSTGINPNAYPVPNIPTDVFTGLPYQTQTFHAAVKLYYGGEGVASNGSQQVIECLPALLAQIADHEAESLEKGEAKQECAQAIKSKTKVNLPILIPHVGYQEHKHAWQNHGNRVRLYPAYQHSEASAFIDQQLAAGEAQHLLIINPNNPTGLRFSAEQIFCWAERMPKGAYIIVDEAFIDETPNESLLSDYPRFLALGNMIVLRSFGKFFGLAGIRLGVSFAAPVLQKRLTNILGPWSVNGPAQFIAERALQDRQWQSQTRHTLSADCEQTKAIWQPLFSRLGAEMANESGLFISAYLPSDIAQGLYEFLAQRGILVRIIGIPELSSQCSLDDLAEAMAEQKPKEKIEEIQKVKPVEKPVRSLLRSGLIKHDSSAQVTKLREALKAYTDELA